MIAVGTFGLSRRPSSGGIRRGRTVGDRRRFSEPYVLSRKHTEYDVYRGCHGGFRLRLACSRGR